MWFDFIRMQLAALPTRKDLVRTALWMARGGGIHHSSRRGGRALKRKLVGALPKRVLKELL
jgi:hypothetical protein